MMKNIFMLGATAAGCAIVAYAFWTTSVPDADDEDDHHHHDEEFVHFSDELIKTHGIELRQAAEGTLKQRVRAPARITLVADQVAHVLPKVGGVALVAYKNLGESVAAGDVLAVLESREMAEAKSAYLTAQKKRQLAEGMYNREKNLHEKKLTSSEEFNRVESAYGEAVIDLELSSQKLHALGLSSNEIEQLSSADAKTMRTYELRSPIAGKVIARHITPGELLSPSNEVYVIADLATVWAEINVFAHDRENVKTGQSVTIIGPQGQTAESTVVYLSPVVDEETRTSTAIVSIDNTSEKWLPGTFAQAEFITEAISVPLQVPRDAIQNIEGSDVIFIHQDDGFAVRPITKGRSDEDCCEVLSGLTPGDSYASKNTFLLKADLKKDEAEHMD